MEILLNCGEWKVVDPETGRQLEEPAHDQNTKINVKEQHPKTVQPASIPSINASNNSSSPASKEPEKNLQNTQIVEIIRLWRLLEKEVDSRGTGVFTKYDRWLQFLGTLAAFPMSNITETLYHTVKSVFHTLNRILGSVSKSAHQQMEPSEFNGFLEVRAVTLVFCQHLLRSMQTNSNATWIGDLCYHVVRCCNLFSTILNSCCSSENASSDEIKDYKRFYNDDLVVISAILQADSVELFNARSKTLKWLGSMLDRSHHLTTLLEEIMSKNTIPELLCDILSKPSSPISAAAASASTISSPGDLNLYSMFALASFVQPNGKNWKIIQPFPVTYLKNPTTITQMVEEEAKHFYKLRMKAHAEVSISLLKKGINSNGITEMLCLLAHEFTCRFQEEEDDEEAENNDNEDQSVVCCILKILLHACRASAPFSNRLLQTQLPTSLQWCLEQDSEEFELYPVILQLILKAIVSPKKKKSTMEVGVLNGMELYFAVEFLSVLLKRGLFSRRLIWQISCKLFPVLVPLDDVIVLSAFSMFFSEAIEIGEIDSTIRKEIDVKKLSDQEKEVYDLLVENSISPLCMEAILKQLRVLTSSPSQDDRVDWKEKRRMLTCYNIRAQGVLDTCIVLLLRVASKLSKKISKSHTHFESETFANTFQNNGGLWKAMPNVLNTSGQDYLSPWGLFCIVKLIRTIREYVSSSTMDTQRHPEYQVEMEKMLNGKILPQLVNLLDLSHIRSLLKWPEVIGGGSHAVKALVHAIVKVLGLPFMNTSVTEEALIDTQEVLYDVGCVQKLLAVIRFVATTNEFQAEHSVLELPMSFLSRLVTSSAHFGTQFVEADGMKVIKECGMLNMKPESLLEKAKNTQGSVSLIIDTLLIASQLARSSKDNYDCIHQANLLPELRDLLYHSEAMVRAKAANCVGNLCRHSTLFYSEFVSPLASPSDALFNSVTVLDGLIACLNDTDPYVRRFACFAIGNAAFHTNDLYKHLEHAIPLLIKNLQDEEEKTRSNASGALGNLVRNSDELCGALCVYEAPLALFDQAKKDQSTVSRRIALFSLGNFCVYGACLTSLLQAAPDFMKELENLYEEIPNDQVSRKNIRRILTKVSTCTPDIHHT
jgi:fused-like protein